MKTSMASTQEETTLHSFCSECCDWVFKHLITRSDVDVIYPDLINIAYKVYQWVICHKLQRHVVVGKMEEWLHDFLKEKCLTIAANGGFLQ